MDLVDDVNFTLVTTSALYGSPLHVLGAHTHKYKKNHWSCFAMCAGAADCGGFTDYKSEHVCAFSRRNARLRRDMERHDVFVRKSTHPGYALPTPMKMSSLLPPQSMQQSHRIFVVNGFLSSSEAASLRKFAAGCLSRKTALDLSMEPRAVVGSPSCPPGSAAVLLSRVEDRIAQLTGMDAHEDEETISFQHTAAVGAVGPWFENLHHDKNKQPRRKATVRQSRLAGPQSSSASAACSLTNSRLRLRSLVSPPQVIAYLTSTTDEEGGHTIFPTLSSGLEASEAASENGDGKDEGGSGSSGSSGSSGPGGAAEAMRGYRRAAQDAYARGKRALGCRDSSAGCGDVGGLVAHSEAECKRALRGSSFARGLAIRPQAGRALVFWSEGTDGEADAQMWHTGCLARHFGAEHGRWILQKFKSPPLPAEHRREAAVESEARLRDEL